MTWVSVPTAWLSADVETWTDARMTCAVAVTPTMTRKTPYTMNSRIGRGGRPIGLDDFPGVRTAGRASAPADRA